VISNPASNEEKSSIKSFSEYTQEFVEKDLWKKFIRHCVVVQRLNPRSTVPCRTRKLKYLERNGIDLVNFDENQVHTFFYDMLQNGSANTALNNYVKALNSWLKFRELKQKFDKFKEHKVPVKVPSIQDIQAMLDIVSNRTMADRRDRIIIVFFCKTGLRCSELCNLKLGHIDWRNAEITVKKGKGNKDRIVPVERKVLAGVNYPSLKNYINNWRYETGDFVFTSKTGRLSPVYIRKRIKIIAKKAGVPWIHPHSFRHFYATNLIRSGARVIVVQELLGHSDIRSTSRYLHTTDSDLRYTIQNMPVFDVVRHRGSVKNTKTLFRRFYAKRTGEL